MKKILALLLSVGLVASMTAGCGSAASEPAESAEAEEAVEEEAAEEAEASEEAEAPEEAAEAEEPAEEELPVLNLTIAHSAAGGTWNTIAEGLAEILRNEYPGSTITVVPGSGEGNIAQMAAGQVDLALTTSADAKDAMLGVEHFETPITDIQAICALFSPAVQIFVNEDVPINSVEELIEQKYPINISVHTQGSGIEIAARRVFEAYGFSYEDIESWGGKVQYVGAQEAAEMMGNGQLDAYFGFSTVPINNFTELDVQHDFKVLPLSDEVIAAMEADWEYPAGTIPAGAYDSVTEDIPTISETTGLYAGPSVDQDTIYYVTKAFLNHMDEMGNIHARLADLSADYMMEDTVYPLAEGAVKAYEE